MDRVIASFDSRTTISLISLTSPLPKLTLTKTWRLRQIFLHAGFEQKARNPTQIHIEPLYLQKVSPLDKLTHGTRDVQSTARPQSNSCRQDSTPFRNQHPTSLRDQPITITPGREKGKKPVSTASGQTLIRTPTSVNPTNTRIQDATANGTERSQRFLHSLGKEDDNEFSQSESEGGREGRIFSRAKVIEIK